MNTSKALRRAALLGAAALALSACGGGAGSGEAPTPAGGAPAGAAGGGGQPEELDSGEIPGTGVEGGPEFDLSGKTVVATTSPPGAINMGTFWAYKRLEEWGADVETVIVTTTSGVQAIVADRADLASQGSDEVVLGAAEGANTVAIGAPSTAMDYVLVARGDAESVEDLEGKTIGMSGPSGFDALLSRLSVERAGLDAGSDVNFVQIGGSPDRAAALLAAQVDAATIFLEDWEELSRQTEELQLVQYMAEIVPDFPATAYFAQADYWEDNPEVALALACANLQANVWLNSSEDEYVEYVLQVVPGATEEAARAIYQHAQEVNMWPTEPDRLLSVDGMAGLIDAMLETGDITEPVEAEEVVDVSYLEEAADMGCNEQ